MSTGVWVYMSLYAVAAGLIVLASALFARWLWLVPLTPEQKQDSAFVREWRRRSMIPAALTAGLTAAFFIAMFQLAFGTLLLDATQRVEPTTPAAESHGVHYPWAYISHPPKDAESRAEIVAWADEAPYEGSYYALSEEWLTLLFDIGSGVRIPRAYVYARCPASRSDPKPWKLLYTSSMPGWQPSRPDWAECVYVDDATKSMVFASRTGKVLGRLDIAKGMAMIERSERWEIGE